MRPLKIAFLVNSETLEDVQRAVQLASSQWGGQSHPIISINQRSEIDTRDLVSEVDYQVYLNGFLNAFSPDYVVPIGVAVETARDFCIANLLTPEDLIPDNRTGYDQKFGISLVPILEHFYQSDYRFAQKSPRQFIEVQGGFSESLFRDVLFGAFSPELTAVFDSKFRTRYQPASKPIDFGNYLDHIGDEFLSCNRINELYIDQEESTRIEDYSVFIFDALNTDDLIELWNLRAYGTKIIPLPVQSRYSDVITEGVRSRLEKVLKTEVNSIHSPKPGVLVVKSGAVSILEFNSILPLITPEVPHEILDDYYLTNLHSPRYWHLNPDSNVYDARGEAISKKASLSIETTRDVVNLEGVFPEFIPFHSGLYKHGFVNEISFQADGFSEPVAEIIPIGNYAFDALSSHYDSDSWRISSNGLNFLVSNYNKTIKLRIPYAQAIFEKWFCSKGLTACLSEPAGLTSKTILRQLGGIRGTSILSIPGIIELLRDMNRDDTMSREEFKSRIHKISNKDPRIDHHLQLIKSLTDLKIINLGVKVKCPTCSIHSWYTLEAITYIIICHKCHQSFKLPIYDIDSLGWAYRPIGAFALPDYAFGAYSVLLTLRFFVTALQSSVTPMLPFETRDGSRSKETDLGIFARIRDEYSSQYTLFLIEAKSFNSFGESDVNNLLEMGARFPGSHLVFSSLRNKLSDSEVRLISTAVDIQLERKRRGEAYNTVWVLGERELRSEARHRFDLKSDFGAKRVLDTAVSSANSYEDFALLTQYKYLL